MTTESKNVDKTMVNIDLEQPHREKEEDDDATDDATDDVVPAKDGPQANCCRDENAGSTTTGCCYEFRFGYKSWKTRNAAYSALAVNAFVAGLSINAAFAILSVNSMLSLASVNSILSIASVNSALTIGCSGEFMKICLSGA